MLKKVLLTILILLGVAGLGGCYLWLVGRMERTERAKVVCPEVRIAIKGDGSNLIGKDDILEIIDGGKGIVGMKADSVDLCGIERKLAECGEILESQAYLKADGTVRLDIRHRHAALRLLCGNGVFYSDPTGYLFPLRNPADVPVVTGRIPLQLGSRFQGRPRSQAEAQWLKGLLALGSYIEEHDFWHRQVAQIDVNPNGDLILYMNSGSEQFILGSAEDLPVKFDKISRYYRSIAPLRGAKPYQIVNLKFRDQIVCK